MVATLSILIVLELFFGCNFLCGEFLERQSYIPLEHQSFHLLCAFKKVCDVVHPRVYFQNKHNNIWKNQQHY